MRAWLRHEGEEFPTDLADLDEDIRQGRLPGDAELRHPPWTGERFQRLRDIAQLCDALDTPSARFAAHLLQRRRTWLTGAVAAVVVLVAMVQVSLASSQQPGAAALLARTFGQWMVGLEPTLLDGRWWTPWTSQLTHADLLHALFNAPIIAYCGYRVEQAIAPSGALAVMAAAILGGSVAIVGFGTTPVVGSSIIAYGLWGAQIAIGLRMGDAIPPQLRGRYGMGNLIFFAPLYAASLFNPSVSHLGHAGALAGGIAVAVAITAETMAPAALQLRWRVRVLSLAGLLTAAPVLLQAVAVALPAVAYGLHETVEVPDTGLTITLPSRLTRSPLTVGGMTAWRASVNSTEPIFADLFLLDDREDDDRDWLDSWWAQALGGEVERAPPPPPLAAGWTAYAFTVRTPQGSLRVVEHHLQRGRWLVRAGYYTRPATSGIAGRERLYQQILSTLQVGDPPTLTAATAQLARNPASPSLLFDYARELHRLDRALEADAAYARLDTRTDGWQWDAARARLKLWLEHPEVATLKRRDWLLGYLDRAPAIDETIHRRGIRWLVSQGDCLTAQQHLRRLSTRADAAPLMPALRQLLTGCSPALSSG